jgi:hypothetical protein
MTFDDLDQILGQLDDLCRDLDPLDSEEVHAIAALNCAAAHIRDAMSILDMSPAA